MGLGPWEILLVLLAVILIFGGKKLPELARGLGLGLKEFKKATKEIQEEVEKASDEVKDNTEALDIKEASKEVKDEIKKEPDELDK
jgi:sec-independent protein translocase protein TatA